MGAYDQFSSKNKDGDGSKRKNRRNGASPGGQLEKAVFTADKAGGDTQGPSIWYLLKLVQEYRGQL